MQWTSTVEEADDGIFAPLTLMHPHSYQLRQNTFPVAQQA